MASFAATAAAAAERCAVDAAALAAAARARARELWRAAPTYPFCRRIGISSWEGLWCRFEGAGDDLRALRAWAPDFRREAWRRALADQGVDDDAFAAELGERFGAERRARCETFADAAAALDALRGEYALALVTNGASCLQREKLAASGLADRFDAIVVSGDLRPRPRRARRRSGRCGDGRRQPGQRRRRRARGRAAGGVAQPRWKAATRRAARGRRDRRPGCVARGARRAAVGRHARRAAARFRAPRC